MAELGVCLVSHDVVNIIESFSVHQENCLPSDHAPISIEVNVPVISLDNFTAARHLGAHAWFESLDLEHDSRVRRPVGFTCTDRNLFTDNVHNLDILTDINECAESLANTLYDCAKSSRYHGERVRGGGSMLTRWERLLEDRDDRRVWQAINWRGNLHDSVQADIKPSDEESKLYNNLMNVPTPDVADECRDAQVMIPVLTRFLPLRSQLRLLRLMQTRLAVLTA
ncbi:hypothetical protein E2C01_034003 [Portunus trituberculatus]|uniref:Endonuclease/exonuclease/phosphatase domain-containing protein n=1 Tax=Portunus trituberculatus TaxID=210409 RepID=A0A5B7F4Y5_PORTR|nr:hypothetical protein [Portunus trituberculatus]